MSRPGPLKPSPVGNYGEVVGQAIPLPGRDQPPTIGSVLVNRRGPNPPYERNRDNPRYEAPIPRVNPRYEAQRLLNHHRYEAQLPRGNSPVQEESRGPRAHGSYGGISRSDPSEFGASDHSRDLPQAPWENQDDHEFPQNEERPWDDGRLPRSRRSVSPEQADDNLSEEDLNPRYANRPLTPAALLYAIRRWNVSFSGRSHEDVESFIARVDEGRAFINARDCDLVRAIPFLFEGSALNWYRGHARHLQTWNSLRDALRCYFAAPDYQIALQEEISRRTQDDHESVRDYLSSMRGYFNRLQPRWSDYTSSARSS